MENELIKILYIDDEKAALFNFEQLFHDDFEIYTAISAAQGMEILDKTDIQIIVSDQRMPDKTGIQFFAEVAQLYPNTIRILLTAYSEAEVIIDAINRGQVYQYITKPFETQNVKNILDKAAQSWRLKKENEVLITQLQDKNEEYEAINEELRHTNDELYAGNKRIIDLVERLSLSQEASSSGSWDWDIQTNTFYWSEEFLKLFGMEPGTVPGFEAWTERLHPDDIELASKRIQDAIDEKRDLLQFYRIVLPNGNLRWIRAMGTTTYQNDVPVRMVGLCIDVTDQKQAEEKLLTSEVKFRAVTELSPLAIYASSGSDQKGIYINETFYKIFGFTMEDVPTVGVWWIKAFPDEKYRQQIMDQWVYNIEQADKYNTDVEILECVCTCKDGSEKIIGWIGKTIGDEFWAFGYDFTERKQAEQKILESEIELRKVLDLANQSRRALLGVLEDQHHAQQKLNQLNAELEQRVTERTAQLSAVNKELETFSYSVSHDLKAPLRGIDGYSKLLLDLYSKELNEEARNFLNTIRGSTLQMNRLIEDLLDYSKLERSQFRKEKINLADMIASILSIYKNQLSAGNFSVKAEIPRIELEADERGLAIALRNLIENSIKFTAGRTNPELEISVVEKRDGWIIQLRDNGIGFDMKYHQRIFEIFQRLHKAEDFQGTGIGLAMVAKAMQRMQGKAWAESQQGIGSTFYLEIPKMN